jgi:23S rRNA pseudouridine2605 synthase
MTNIMGLNAALKRSPTPTSASLDFSVSLHHRVRSTWRRANGESRTAAVSAWEGLMPAERLQKIIAAAGIASRRKAEELITSGLVSVNGQTVTELGSKADPEHDRIKVNGKPLSGPERHVYLLLHKPKGYVTTVTDPEGRPTVLDLLRGVGTRVYPVGRLDYLSEGLLLLTNDGELAQKLTHASSHVPKTYLVKVSGKPREDQIEKLRGGILLPARHAPLKTPVDKPPRGSWRRSTAVQTAPVRLKLLREATNPWYEVTLFEGRNRQIRRMFEAIEHHVEKIKRVRYGPLQLDVEAGKFRHLTAKEVVQLKSAVGGRRAMGAADALKEAIKGTRESWAAKQSIANAKEQIPRRLEPARDDKYKRHHRGAKAGSSAKTNVRGRADKSKGRNDRPVRRDRGSNKAG